MAKKKAAKSGMSLNDFYNEVAKCADTEGLQIGAADTKRVLACFFDVLIDQPSSISFDIIAKGISRAQGRKSK